MNGGFLVNQRNWKSTIADAGIQRIYDMWALSWTAGVSGSAESMELGGVKINSNSVIGNDPGGAVTNWFEGAINGKWTLSVFMKIDSIPLGSNIAIQIANDTKQQYPGFAITPDLAVLGKYAIYSLTADISGWEDSDTMRVSIYNYGGPAAFSINFVKLEPGENQTSGYLDKNGDWRLFIQPDMDYTTQLLRCQFYFEKTDYFVSYVTAQSTSYINPVGSLQYKVKKRIIPTITVNPNVEQTVLVYDTTTNNLVPGCTLQTQSFADTNMLCPFVQGVSLVIGRVYRVEVQKDAYLVSAEL